MKNYTCEKRILTLRTVNLLICSNIPKDVNKTAEDKTVKIRLKTKIQHSLLHSPLNCVPKLSPTFIKTKLIC